MAKANALLVSTARTDRGLSSWWHHRTLRALLLLLVAVVVVRTLERQHSDLLGVPSLSLMHPADFLESSAAEIECLLGRALSPEARVAIEAGRRDYKHRQVACFESIEAGNRNAAIAALTAGRCAIQSALNGSLGMSSRLGSTDSRQR